MGLHSEKRFDLTLRIMPNQHFTLPPLAERLLSRALDEEERSVRLGDLEKLFQFKAREEGKMRARAWYRRQVLALMILSGIKRIRWSFIMFKKNVKIAIRHLRKHKGYSYY